MRLLGILAALLIMLSGAALVGVLARPIVAQMFPGAFIAQEPPRGVQSPVYRLDGARWTRYPLSSPPRSVRILSNADLRTDAAHDPASTFRYAIDYRMLGASGNILSEGTLHYRARVNLVQDRETGAPTSRYALPGLQGVPSSTYASVLALAETPAAAFIELRLGDTDDGVGAASVRLAERRIPVGSLEAAWQRLSPSEQQQLARHHPYPAELLTDAERRNLIDSVWLPVGPVGVEGRDYVRALLSTRSGETLPVVTPPERPGMYMDETRSGSLRLPEGGGPLSLRVTPADDVTTEGLLSIDWYGTDGLRETHTLAWSLDQPENSVRFEPGLVEFTSDVPVRLRAEATDGRDLASERIRLRVFVASQDQDVVYPVLGDGVQPVPMRLALRSLVDGPETALAEYRVHAADGTILAQDTVSFQPQPSRYDRVSETPDVGVSDPAIVFFNLPADAAQLVLSSSSPLLVSASTRPPGAPRRMRLPEDRFGVEIRTAPRPDWFLVRPDTESEGAGNGRSVILETQIRPPSQAADGVSAGFIWQRIATEPATPSATLFVMRIPENIDPRGHPAVFSQIPVGEDVEIAFPPATEGVQEPISPTILVHRTAPEQARPTSVELRVAGAVVFQGIIEDPNAEIPVPPFAIGVQTLRIEASDPVEAYVSRSGLESGRLMRREGFVLLQDEMSVEIEKRSPDEMVIAHLVPAPGEGRTLVRLELDGPEKPAGAFRGWSFDTLEGDIQLSPDARVIVLGADQRAGQENRLVLPLREDLPLGRYTLTLRLDEGPPVFVLLTQGRPAETGAPLLNDVPFDDPVLQGATDAVDIQP
jgi:hypothetical protein